MKRFLVNSYLKLLKWFDSKKLYFTIKYKIYFTIKAFINLLKMTNGNIR